MNLDGFDYVTYLKRRLMVGEIDPWRKTDEGKKLYTLLVSVEIAMEECQLWSGQEFTRHDFINYLKVNDVLTFKNIEDVVNLRESKVEETKIERKPKGKRVISEEEKMRRKEQMKQINQKKTDQLLKVTLS